MTSEHIPVMVEETLRYLINRKDGIYVDATLGTGGHFQALSEALAPQAVLIGMDADPIAVNYCRDHRMVPQRHFYIQTNFTQLQKYCFRYGYARVHGILLDLGLSSLALDDPARGFSYQLEGPLDMRFSPQSHATAADFINRAEEQELIRVFTKYGEERNSRRIARAFVAARRKQPIKTTRELADIIRKNSSTSHPQKTLSRIFQSIRIHINHEIEALQKALAQSVDILEKGGKLVIITYHSLEDRLVKQIFNRESRDCICPPSFPVCRCNHKARLKILTAKPLRPSGSEIQLNPRSRSAKLRAAQRI